MYCLDGKTGRTIWEYTAGGKVDLPPTIYKGVALFGSADGWVYCVRATDGALAFLTRHHVNSPVLTPADKGCLLFADDNNNEPGLVGNATFEILAWLTYLLPPQSFASYSVSPANR